MPLDMSFLVPHGMIIFGVVSIFFPTCHGILIVTVALDSSYKLFTKFACLHLVCVYDYLSYHSIHYPLFFLSLLHWFDIVLIWLSPWILPLEKCQSFWCSFLQPVVWALFGIWFLPCSFLRYCLKKTYFCFLSQVLFSTWVVQFWSRLLVRYYRITSK